ncbi:MAG: S4 domain-containing protein [Candidatus Omnitrophota bacterium]
MHPKEAKLKLAQTIVTQYYSEKLALAAREEFGRVFSKRQIPRDIAEFKIKGARRIVEIIIESKISKSGNEARRLIRQGAVSFNNQKIKDENFVIDSSGILKVGSRRFFNIKKQ